MNGWPLIKLDDVIVQRKPFITIDDTTMYKRPRVQLHTKGIVLRDRIVGADIRTKKQQVCGGSDFLVAEIDAKVGGFGIVPPELDGAIVSSHYFLFEALPERLDRNFLGYVSRSQFFRAQVAAKGSTNYAAIRPADVLSYQIPLPPLPEQQAIVARLDALDAKTQQLLTHLDAIEAAAEAIVLSTHHKLSKGNEVALSQVIELYEERESVVPDGEYPQVGVRSFGGGLFPKAAVTMFDTTYRAFNKLYPEAIVLSQVKGWEGAIALTPPNLVGRFASPEYRTFRCIPKESSPEYLATLFNTAWFWSLLQQATRGVGARRERTRPEQFLDLTLPMPGYDDQCRAAEMFSRLAKLKAHHANIRTSIEALMPSTLDQLFGSNDA